MQMVILKSSAPADLKEKNAFVVTLIKELRIAKMNAENRLALVDNLKDKAYYQALIADYSDSIQSAINCYITVY